jgi:hypothetical protein
MLCRGKSLPLPLRAGVGVRGLCLYCTETSCRETPPPNPLPQGEGENIVPVRLT